MFNKETRLDHLDHLGHHESNARDTRYKKGLLITVQRDATQSSVFIILEVHSTCFGCQLYPSLGVHKTVTTAFGTGHIFCAVASLQRGQASLATLEGGSCTKSMASTEGCSYSFMYS
jgi:hypothetical protein